MGLTRGSLTSPQRPIVSRIWITFLALPPLALGYVKHTEKKLTTSSTSDYGCLHEIFPMLEIVVSQRRRSVFYYYSTVNSPSSLHAHTHWSWIRIWDCRKSIRIVSGWKQRMKERNREDGYYHICCFALVRSTSIILFFTAAVRTITHYCDIIPAKHNILMPPHTITIVNNSNNHFTHNGIDMSNGSISPNIFTSTVPSPTFSSSYTAQAQRIAGCVHWVK